MNGEILNIGQLKQVIVFQGLKAHGKLTITDIDGFMNYSCQAFIYLEAKFKGTPIKQAQRMSLEALVQSNTRAGHKACCILFRHCCQYPEPVEAAGCFVDSVYYNTMQGHRWVKARTETVTVRQAIDWWEDKIKYLL